MKYIDICIALYDYQSQTNEELSFNANDTLYIFDKGSLDWYKAQLKTKNADGPIGLVPANYIEKAKSIGTLRALYDYQARSIEELPFKENDMMTLYDKDDPDWYFIETKNGEFGLVPSNYVETDIQTVSRTYNLVSKPVCEPKWGIALYNFIPQDKEETQLQEHEQVLVTDHVSSQDWWTVEHKDGTSGVVPATYIQFHDEYQSESIRKEEEKKRVGKEELERMARMNEDEEKERSRQAESERRRRMQEEAKQREIEAKKRQAAAAKASTALSPSNQPGNNSPRRSEIPAPPPPVSAPLAQNQHFLKQDPNKPDPTKIRWWTDRTGAFKVEAQLLSCSSGKIKLFKTNGVKIDVPVEKMCIDDLKYVEQETGQRLLDGTLPQFSWFAYFKKINIPHETSARYAKAFERENFTERDLERLTYGRMKSLGMAEKHVRRLQRFIETNQAEPLSDDEGSKPKLKKKKSVTFGPVTYIEDHAIIVGGDDETGGYLVFETQHQISKDEQLARMLQEQENRQDQQTHSSTHSVGLHRRPTGRPTPSHPASRGVDLDAFTNTLANQELFKPTPAQLQMQSLQPSPVQHTTSHNQTAPARSHSGFDDDAWAPRPSQQPSTHSFDSSTFTDTTINSTLSQQNSDDPQLASNWGGNFSLSSQTANPSSLGYNQAKSVFSQNSSQQPPLGSLSNSSFTRTSPSFQPQQPNNLTINNSLISSSPSLQNQQSVFGQSIPLTTGNSNLTGTSPSLQHQASFNQMNSLTVNNNSFSKSSPSLQNQQLNSFIVNNNFTGSSPQLSQMNSLAVGNNSFTGSSFQQQQQFLSPSPSLQPLASNPLGIPPMVPQPSNVNPIQTQTTGARNWTSATPDNPFGNKTPQGNFQPQNVSQPTGYSLDPNDKYAIFKTINTSTPSILKPAALQQQQTGFGQMPNQQYNGSFMNQQQW